VGEDEADAERRRRCGVLTAVIFKTKPLLGWEMIQAVHRAGTRWARWVACDEAFGRAPTLLDHIASRGLWDCAEVPHDMQGWQQRPATAVPAWGGRGRQPTRARVVAGAPAPQTVVMVAEVAALRVIAMGEGLPGPAVWLVLRRNLVTGELKTYLSLVSTSWTSQALRPTTRRSQHIVDTRDKDVMTPPVSQDLWAQNGLIRRSFNIAEHAQF
jgi:DDE superfamily endonuclease